MINYLTFVPAGQPISQLPLNKPTPNQFYDTGLSTVRSNLVLPSYRATDLPSYRASYKAALLRYRAINRATELPVLKSYLMLVYIWWSSGVDFR